ncbi:MAG: division/cell wall cluster transcriptional repressor MraZ [Fusobacteria bacterium]|nr:division/cell wall cluster transcriptional repressor MraZ [Fusobacteriota bacterium]
MFMGEFNHTLDEKNRVILPSKLRDAFLAGDYVLTKGLDNCLFLYPINEWEILAEKLRGLSMTKQSARAFTRLLLAGASNSSFDKQGRISIPDTLKAHAEIDKEVVITGVLNRIEIWSKENWTNYSKAAEETFEETAEELIDF